MSFWEAFLVGLVISALITELILRLRGKKYIRVGITDKNGSRRVVKIRTGRDPEVDELISRIKRRKAEGS